MTKLYNFFIVVEFCHIVLSGPDVYTTHHYTFEPVTLNLEKQKQDIVKARYSLSNTAEILCR